MSVLRATIKVTGDVESAIKEMSADGLTLVKGGPQWINVDGERNLVQALRRHIRVLLYAEDELMQVF